MRIAAYSQTLLAKSGARRTQTRRSAQFIGSNALIRRYLRRRRRRIWDPAMKRPPSQFDQPSANRAFNTSPLRRRMGMRADKRAEDRGSNPDVADIDSEYPAYMENQLIALKFRSAMNSPRCVMIDIPFRRRPSRRRFLDVLTIRAKKWRIAFQDKQFARKKSSGSGRHGSH